MAAISSGSNFMNPVLDEPIDGARSIVGFGLASQAGFDSLAVAMSAKSSGEHETSFTSPLGTDTRGRVWAIAELVKTASAKPANTKRGNRFRSSINREVPSLLISNFLVFLREEGTAKTFGTLSVERWGFKRQCDCFVTKRLTDEAFALKEVTNQLQRFGASKTMFMGAIRNFDSCNQSI